MAQTFQAISPPKLSLATAREIVRVTDKLYDQVMATTRDCAHIKSLSFGAADPVQHALPSAAVGRSGAVADREEVHHCGPKRNVSARIAWRA
jgi:hypothetical protein